RNVTGVQTCALPISVRRRRLCAGEARQLNHRWKEPNVAKIHTGLGGKTRALVISGLSAAVLAPALMASPAQAYYGEFEGDPDFTGPSTNEVTDTQGGDGNATMFGAYIGQGGVLDGKRVWCADPGLEAPLATAFDKDS